MVKVTEEEWYKQAEEAFKRRQEKNKPWPKEEKKEPVAYDVIGD